MRIFHGKPAAIYCLLGNRTILRILLASFLVNTGVLLILHSRIFSNNHHNAWKNHEPSRTSSQPGFCQCSKEKSLWVKTKICLCLHNRLAIEYLSFDFVARWQPSFIVHPSLSSRHIPTFPVWNQNNFGHGFGCPPVIYGWESPNMIWAFGEIIEVQTSRLILGGVEEKLQPPAELAD